MLLAICNHDPGLNDPNTVFGKSAKLSTRQPWLELLMVPDADRPLGANSTARQSVMNFVRFVERVTAPRLDPRQRP